MCENCPQTRIAEVFSILGCGATWQVYRETDLSVIPCMSKVRNTCISYFEHASPKLDIVLTSLSTSKQW